MHRQTGMTLLEVLIALTIIAIALMAIIKATTDSIRGNMYLREKTIATWVALHTLNQARLGLIQLPEAPALREQNQLMLNHRWQWRGYRQKTSNAHIQALHVEVFHQPEHRFITELTSDVYAA